MSYILNFECKYIDDVMKIWLNSNINTHYFIKEFYWHNNFDFVKQCIKNSEVYVYINNKNILCGFIGIENGYIQGLFVDENFRSIGIGKFLLDYVKNLYNRLEVSVYEKNIKAVNFYKKNNFNILERIFKEDTMEYEYKMLFENG